MDRGEVKGPSPGYPKLSVLEQWCLHPKIRLHLWLPSCAARLVSPGFAPPDQCMTPSSGPCIHHPISSATVLQKDRATVDQTGNKTCPRSRSWSGQDLPLEPTCDSVLSLASLVPDATLTEVRMLWRPHLGGGSRKTPQQLAPCLTKTILWKCISDKTGLQKAKITQGLLFLISLFRRAHGKMTETCHVMWQGQERNTAQFFFKAIKTPGRRHLKEICKKEF